MTLITSVTSELHVWRKWLRSMKNSSKNAEMAISEKMQNSGWSGLALPKNPLPKNPGFWVLGFWVFPTWVFGFLGFSWIFALQTLFFLNVPTTNLEQFIAHFYPRKGFWESKGGWDLPLNFTIKYTIFISYWSIVTNITQHGVHL